MERKNTNCLDSLGAFEGNSACLWTSSKLPCEENRMKFSTYFSQQR